MAHLSPFWSDILRYLAFGQGLIVLVLSSVIVARYSFKVSITKARDRALPWHIVLIGISYIGLTFFAILELRGRMGNPVTWRTPAALFFFACGDAAFIFMLIHLSVQRVIVTALLDRMTLKLEEDLEQLKQTTAAAATKAEVAAEKAEIAAQTGTETHAAVAEIKMKLENGER